MKVKLAVVFAIVGLIVPSLAQAQNVRTFGAGWAMSDLNGSVHGI